MKSGNTSYLQKSILTILIITVCCSLRLAANDKSFIGARSGGLGGVSITLKDIWSAYNNQAGLCELNHIKAGFDFKSIYLIKELGMHTFVLGIPVGNGAMGISFNRIALPGYSDNITGFSYSRKFGNKFYAGIQLDYIFINTSAKEYQHHVFSFEFGSIYDINNDLSIAFHAFNPIPFKLNKGDYYIIGSTFKLGLIYHIAGNVLILAETEKSQNIALRFRGGIEYSFSGKFVLRAGFASNPAVLSFGTGLHFGRFTIDMASAYDLMLGFTPQISITYSFKPK